MTKYNHLLDLGGVFCVIRIQVPFFSNVKSTDQEHYPILKTSEHDIVLSILDKTPHLISSQNKYLVGGMRIITGPTIKINVFVYVRSESFSSIDERTGDG